MNKRGFLKGAFPAAAAVAAAAAAVPTVAQASGLPPVFTTPSNTGLQGGGPLAIGTNIVGPTSGPGFSVTLPVGTGSGQIVEIINRSPFFVLIFPPVGGQMMNFNTNIGFAQYPITYLRFMDTGPNQWDFLYNIASTFPIYANIAARAGGGHAAARELGYGTSVIVTCASRGDSVRLPIALGAGEQLFITNHGTATCFIYPNPGERINTLAVNAYYPLQSGKAAFFSDVGPPNQWDGGTLG